jgi:hypothetical protein
MLTVLFKNALGLECRPLSEVMLKDTPPTLQPASQGAT